MDKRNHWSQNDTTVWETDTDEVVLYVKDITPDVIATVISMWNSNEPVDNIGRELDKIDGVSLDQADYLIDEIKKYRAVTNRQANTMEAGSAVKHEGITGNEISPEVKFKEELQIGANIKLGKSKPTRARSTVAGNGKKVDTASVIEGIKAQIEKGNRLLGCIGYVESSICLPDNMPDGIKKPEIEALIQYTRELEAVQSKYLQIIQKL